MSKRILTTHVGSLPRPPALTELLVARDRGDLADAAVAALAEASVHEIVARQAAAGLDLVSDGEQNKVGYSTYMLDRLTGFSEGHTPARPALDMAPYPELLAKINHVMGEQKFRRAVCDGPVTLASEAPFRRDIAVMKAAMEAAGVRHGFLNAASPGLITAFLPNRYYPTHQAYLEAAAAAMQAEYEAIVEAGLQLQLDCPDIAMSRHLAFQDLTEAEFVRQAETHVEAMNWALRNIPSERVRMHVCWGNYEGPHDHDIPLERILDLVLKAKPSTILFEGANPRHEHEWAVWAAAKIPADKILAPGLIDSCSNYVEHPELVAQRIERYAAIVGPDRVIASTDCGFGTTAGRGKVDSDVVWKKFAALVEGARIAAGRV